MPDPGQDQRGLSQRELLRKLIHIAVGLGAFAVAFLGSAHTALLLTALLVFNTAIWPHFGGRTVWRRRDARQGVALGIVLYPLVLLVLVLVFWNQLEVVAAVWAILAFGDGMAAIAGRSIGRAKLPWNLKKSWAGSLAFWLFGTIGAASAIWWTLKHLERELAPAFVLAAACLTALIAAFIESQPLTLDDNLSVPFLSAAFLSGILQSQHYWATADVEALLTSAGIGAAITLALAVTAWFLRAISLSGAVAGVLLGTVIHTFLGWRGLTVLAAFVALGVAGTKLGYRQKAARGLAQSAGGQRGASHAIANAGVPAVLAVFAATTPYAEAFTAAFVAAFAAAASDTLSSEIGQLRAGHTRLITTWKRVPPGTDGGISMAGSLAALAGALIIAGLGWALGWYGVGAVAWVTLAGLLGSVADSVAGATLERRGLLDNHAVNLFNTVVGALVALWIFSGN